MGDVITDPIPAPEVVEHALSWGPVIRGLRWGSGQDRALFLHEPGADIDAWKTLPVLIARSLGLEAIAVDLPGHGLSDDPWEPERLNQLLREMIGESPAERFVIAAGGSALTALEIAADLRLDGLVCLSPDAPPRSTLTPLPPSPIAMGEGGLAPPLPARGERGLGGEGQRGGSTRSADATSEHADAVSVPKSPRVPKLFFAGSMAGNDLETARRLATFSGGWAVVTSVPVAARGTQLLASAWSAHLEEAIAAFLRDCQQRRIPGRDVLRPGHTVFG